MTISIIEIEQINAALFARTELEGLFLNKTPNLPQDNTSAKDKHPTLTEEAEKLNDLYIKTMTFV